MVQTCGVIRRNNKPKKSTTQVSWIRLIDLVMKYFKAAVLIYRQQVDRRIVHRLLQAIALIG